MPQLNAVDLWRVIIKVMNPFPKDIAYTHMHTRSYKPSLGSADPKAPWVPFIQQLFSECLLCASSVLASENTVQRCTRQISWVFSWTLHSRPNILEIENLCLRASSFGFWGGLKWKYKIFFFFHILDIAWTVYNNLIQNWVTVVHLWRIGTVKMPELTGLLVCWGRKPWD